MVTEAASILDRAGVFPLALVVACRPDRVGAFPLVLVVAYLLDRVGAFPLVRAGACRPDRAGAFPLVRVAVGLLDRVGAFPPVLGVAYLLVHAVDCPLAHARGHFPVNSLFFGVLRLREVLEQPRRMRLSA
jgi:hypothetical protein